MSQGIRVCARPGCGEQVVGRADKRFCSKRCVQRFSYATNEHDRERTKRNARASYRRAPAEHRAVNRKWVLANGESVRAYRSAWKAAHAAELAEYNRQWRRVNASVARAHRLARKQRIRDATPFPVSAQTVAARLLYFGDRCWMCGTTATSIDHVKPISAGGLHIPANMRPACMPCNMWKSARWPGVANLSSLVRARDSERP